MAKKSVVRTYTVLRAKHGLNRFKVTSYEDGVLVQEVRLKDDVQVELAKAVLHAKGFEMSEEGEEPIMYKERLPDDDEPEPEDD